MSLRSIVLAIVALLLSATLFIIFSEPSSNPVDGNNDGGPSDPSLIDQAAQLDVVTSGISRDVQGTQASTGTAIVEFYFRSAAGVNGGNISLNDSVVEFQGSYLKLDNVVSGDATVEINVENHLKHLLDITAVDGESQTYDVDLEQASRIRGRVVNADGQAVVGATVAALEDVVDDSLYSLALAEFFNYGAIPNWKSDSTVTDINGEYVMSNLKFSSFNVLVGSGDYRPFKTEHAVKLESAATTDIELITLARGAEVIIHVNNLLEQAVVDAAVQWRPNSLLAKTVIQRNNNIPTFKTDQLGNVAIKALPSDVLTFSVAASGYATQNIDIDLSEFASGSPATHQVTLRPGVSLSGRVVNSDNEACENSNIALLRSTEYSVEAAVTAVRRNGTAVADDGSFTFPDISSGQYYLIAEADDYARSVAGPLTVAEQDMTDVLVTLTRGARLTVTVLDSENVPLNGVTVAAVSVNASNYASEKTNEQGITSFNNLSNGNYQISSVDPSGSQSADMQFKFVELFDEDVVELTLGGAHKTATLTGTVKLADEAIHRARVSIITDSGAKVASTNENGEYQIEDMPLGEFILIVNGNSGLNGNSAFYDSLIIAQEGEARHDIDLPNAGLEVHVTTSSDGSVVAQVPIAVRPLNGTNISGGDFGLTNAEGVAKFPSLNDGEYMVSVGTAAASFISPQDHGLGSKIISGISVRNGMGVERLDVSLDEGATVKVQVVNQAGELMSDVHMHYLDANGQPMNIISLTGTNSKGVAQLKGLPTGPGRIMVRHTDYGMSEFEVNLNEGELVKKRVTLETGTKLMVTVVDENDQPLSGVLVTALDHRGAALSYVWAASETQATQTAYFSGTAQKLGPLPIGNYKIQLIRPGKDIVVHDVFVNGESVQNLRLRFSQE